MARRTPAVEAAIATAAARPRLWKPAEPQRRPKNHRRQSHRRRRGALVADLTGLIDAEHRPAPDARLIMRREPLHQGAQRSLFASDDWRYWGHWTNLGGSPADP